MPRLWLFYEDVGHLDLVPTRIFFSQEEAMAHLQKIPIRHLPEPIGHNKHGRTHAIDKGRRPYRPVQYAIYDVVDTGEVSDVTESVDMDPVVKEAQAIWDYNVKIINLHRV